MVVSLQFCVLLVNGASAGSVDAEGSVAEGLGFSLHLSASCFGLYVLQVQDNNPTAATNFVLLFFFCE